MPLHSFDDRHPLPTPPRSRWFVLFTDPESGDDGGFEYPTLALAEKDARQLEMDGMENVRVKEAKPWEDKPR